MVEFLEILLFILPAYIANATPVVLGGGTPLDFNARFTDGRRILGNGKTIRGFVAGVLGGTLVGGVLALWNPSHYFISPQLQLVTAFMLSLGTMTGDAVGSFIKRRMGVESGRQFFLDTVLFVVFALIFAYSFTLPGAYALENIAVIIGITIILHPLTNMFANKIGLKNVPW